MGKRKPAFYVVVRGANDSDTGIYEGWETACAVVYGVSKSVYMGCQSLEEAETKLCQAGKQPVMKVANKHGIVCDISVSDYREMKKMSPVAQQHLDSAVVKDLLTETLPPTDDVEDWEGQLELTIKKCEESVISFVHDMDSEPCNVMSSTPFVVKTGRSQVIDVSPIVPEQKVKNVQTSIGKLSEPLGVHHMSTQSKPFEKVLKDSTEYSLLLKENSTLKSELVRLKAEVEVLYKKKRFISRHTQTESVQLISTGTQHLQTETVTQVNDSCSQTETETLTDEEQAEVDRIVEQLLDVNSTSTTTTDAEVDASKHMSDESPKLVYVGEDSVADKYLNLRSDPMDTEQVKLNTEQAKDRPTPPPRSKVKNCPTPPPRNKKTLWFVCGRNFKRNPWLSNLHKAPVTIYGRTFSHQEYAYQWKKCIVHGKEDKADEVLRAENSYDAMSIGQSVVTTDDWKTSTKFDVMCEIREAAFCQNKDIREKLLATGVRPLREATKHKTWGGKKTAGNKMGELVEQIRTRFRNGSLTPVEVLEQLNPEATTFVQQKKCVKKGLIFGDSLSQSIHPKLGNDWVFSTVPVSGGQVCPSPQSDKSSLEDKLTSIMSDEDAIGLVAGANDVKTVPLSQFRHGYTSLVKKAKSNGARVICCGLYHRGDSRNSSEREKINKRVDAFNDVIRSIAIQESVEFIHYMKLFETILWFQRNHAMVSYNSLCDSIPWSHTGRYMSIIQPNSSGCKLHLAI